MDVQELVMKMRLPLLQLAQHVGALENATEAFTPCCPQHVEESLATRAQALVLIIEFGQSLQQGVEMVTSIARSDGECGELEELLLARQLLDDLRVRTLRLQELFVEHQQSYLQGLN